jgi:DNA-directed RNA polymerase subunit RPC12/RpoP
MEQLTWKIDLNAKCPHCGEEDTHTFYLNADTLICDKCNKEFNIELWAKDIEVRCSK